MPQPEKIGGIKVHWIFCNKNINFSVQYIVFSKEKNRINDSEFSAFSQIFLKYHKKEGTINVDYKMYELTYFRLSLISH